MKYAVNDEGVTALRAVSQTLIDGAVTLRTTTDELQSGFDDNRDGLGPHSTSISSMLFEIKMALQTSSQPVLALSENLRDIADAYQEVIDNDRYNQSGGGSGGGAAGGSSGSSGRASSSDPMAGVKRIQGEQSVTAAIEATNPHYDKTQKTREYNENCQRCVPAYEARRRGYDVQAKPIPIPDPHRLGQGYNWVSMYKDPKIISCSGNGKKDIIKQMENWGEGARAEIGVDWGLLYGGGGHVFVAEVIDGKVHFIDPQSGSTDCSKYFDYVKSGSAELVRIDNLEFTDKIKECFI